MPVIGSRIAGSIPKNGTVAEPGLVSIAPGNGVTTIDPVSVCLRSITDERIAAVTVRCIY